MNVLTKLDGWEVELLSLSERGAIDMVALRSPAQDQHYDRVRFDRGKMMFLDAAPSVSLDARRQLAVALVNARASAARR